MLTTHNYLIPHALNANAQEAPLLNGLMQELMEAHRMAVQSANLLLATPVPQHPRFNALVKDKALTIAHAKFYTTGSGFGVAYCAFMSLSNVSRHILEACHNKLLPFAHLLDKVDTVTTSFQNLAKAEFQTQIAKLKEACCANTPDASNLLWSVQSLMPALAKLSGQIDNDATGREAIVSEAPSVNALPHLAQLSHIKNFNVYVNQVLTIAQSILNMMSDWQDRLDLFLEGIASGSIVNRFEDQVHAAILYWQSIQTTLTQHLDSPHDHKSKSKVSHINPYPFSAQPWHPKQRVSESWT